MTGTRADRAHPGTVSRLVVAVALASAAAVALLAGCGEDVRTSGAVVPGGHPERGAELIRSYGCASCHTVAGVPGADADVGPPLTDFGERGYIAGELVNDPDNLQRWIRDPQAVEPGTVMPDLGVTEEDARDIAAYLLGQR